MNTATAQEPISPVRPDVLREFQPLIRSGTTDGWTQSNGRALRWGIKDDGLHCEESIDGSHLAIELKRLKLPTDFELTFRWKEGAVNLTRMDDATFFLLDAFDTKLNTDSSPPKSEYIYYRAIQYTTAGNAIRISTVPSDDDQKLYASEKMESIFIGPEVDVGRAAGEWNEGAIICRGSTVEYRLNGSLAVRVDFQGAEFKKLAGNERLPKSWLAGKERGLRLSLIPKGNEVTYRDIMLKDLTSTKP